MEFALRLIFAIGVLWTMVVFLLVLHEYGHAWAMNKVGIKAEMIVIGSVKLFEFKLDGVVHRFGLLPLVGSVTSAGYMRANINKRAFVAAAGPLMSFVIGLVFIFAGMITHTWLAVVCGKCSIFLCVTNLIPLPPMDGWPMLEWALYRRGIVVKEFTKRRLLAVGWVVIGVIMFLSIV
ncbi:site-2 protease family protein [Duganella vulcania]|uniref:Peptidase M50 n=1 Tax=Duganella vulcania TaxID=2692166 RepID=A0A845GH89_9BURK|nr:site-2 protease family protein [Duganella vulcania]MYM92792.1 peptidase M50 [Duganella vulcania]